MRKLWNPSRRGYLAKACGGTSNSKADTAKKTWNIANGRTTGSSGTVCGSRSSASAEKHDKMPTARAAIRTNRRTLCSMRLTAWPHTRRRAEDASARLPGRTVMGAALFRRLVHSAKPASSPGPSNSSGFANELTMTFSYVSIMSRGSLARPLSAELNSRPSSSELAAQGSSRTSRHSGSTQFSFTEVTCRNLLEPPVEMAVTSTKASVVPYVQLQRGRFLAPTTVMRHALVSLEPLG
mmetsp:Transcript_103146/g.308085  ORF Transcript_103146/g.308085 Transcript_103146/m.308085 type:complete len:238 (+) Transcript_103146:288-1001(+)